MVLTIVKFVELIFTPREFDKERFKLPLPREKKPTNSPTTSLPTGLSSWGKSPQSAIETLEKWSDDEPLAPTWNKIETTKDIPNRQRTASITDNDLQLLEEYRMKYPNLNLTIEKLIVGKKYWFDKVPRQDVVEHKRKKGEKGFSDKVMNVLYAIYNAGVVNETENKESPLPKGR